MDPYYASFQEDLIQEGAHFWCYSPEPFDVIASIPDFAAAPPPTTPTPAVAHQSAFTRYLGPPPESSSSMSTDGGWVNIHRRMIGFLRRIPEAEAEAQGGAGACSGGGGEVSSRGFRHMMRERQRRERLSQSYADLHSMLSSRSKADKNSIVQSAAAYVRELKGVKEELKRHNEVLLKARVARSSSESGQETKIRIRMANPTSTIDSMICALRCLKGMDVKARAIRWEFSGGELTAIMSIETKVGATVVERAVQGAVMGHWR